MTTRERWSEEETLCRQLGGGRELMIRKRRLDDGYTWALFGISSIEGSIYLIDSGELEDMFERARVVEARIEDKRRRETQFWEDE